MVVISGPPSGAIRNKPITPELRQLLTSAAQTANVDAIVITSGGQDALGEGTRRAGSTRHDRGRAADLQLVVDGSTISFTDQSAPPVYLAFVTAGAAAGAVGIGADVGYMGNRTIHVGYGTSLNDTTHLTWGTGGRSVNAPQWLRDAAQGGLVHANQWCDRRSRRRSDTRPLRRNCAPRPETAWWSRHEFGIQEDASDRHRTQRRRGRWPGSVMGTCRPGRRRPARRLRLGNLPRAGRHRSRTCR
jgi:hypothetical protein